MVVEPCVVAPWVGTASWPGAAVRCHFDDSAPTSSYFVDGNSPHKRLRLLFPVHIIAIAHPGGIGGMPGPINGGMPGLTAAVGTQPFLIPKSLPFPLNRIIICFLGTPNSQDSKT